MIMWNEPRKSMKIYISGKYSGPEPDSISDNTAKAILAIKQILERGHTPISPHVLFPFEGYFTPEYILSKCVELLTGCDGVYFMDGYKDSTGSKWEMEVATRHNIKQYKKIESIPKIDIPNFMMKQTNNKE
jgi:hypothetical protein